MDYKTWCILLTLLQLLGAFMEKDPGLTVMGVIDLLGDKKIKKKCDVVVYIQFCCKLMF